MADLFVFTLFHFAVVAAFTLTALGAGGAAARALRFAGDAEAVAVRGALGFGILGTAGALLALGGRFSRPSVLGLAALAVLAGGGTIADSARRIARIAKSALRHPAGLIAMFLLAATAFRALWPPSMFDETLYHLPFARAFVDTHHLPFLPETRFPAFPQLGETLFAEILAVSDDVGARLISAVFAGLTVLGFVAAGRRFSCPRAGTLAACVWLGMPMVFRFSGWAYVEAPEAAFVILAFLAWEIWRRTGESGWLSAAGALGGFAIATKMLAAYPVACLFVFTLREAVRGRRPRIVMVFTLASLLAGGLWYTRSLVETGDPFFPVGPRIFAQSPFHRRDWQPGTASYGRAPQAGSQANLVARMPSLFRSGRFAKAAALVVPGLSSGGHPPLAPWVVLAALIAASDVSRRPVAARCLLAAVVSVLPANLYDGRYLIPAASLAVAAFAASDRASWLARGKRLVPLAILAASFSLALAAGDLVSRRTPPVSPAERERFLSGKLRAYSAIEWLNRRFGSGYTAFGLRAENLLYFARGRLLGDWTGLTPFEDVASAKSGDELAGVLTRFGAGWLLFDPKTSPRPLPDDDSFHRRFALAFRSNGVDLYRIVPGPGGLSAGH